MTMESLIEKLEAEKKAICGRWDHLQIADRFINIVMDHAAVQGDVVHIEPFQCEYAKRMLSSSGYPTLSQVHIHSLAAIALKYMDAVTRMRLPDSDPKHIKDDA